MSAPGGIALWSFRKDVFRGGDEVGGELGGFGVGEAEVGHPGGGEVLGGIFEISGEGGDLPFCGKVTERNAGVFIFGGGGEIDIWFGVAGDATEIGEEGATGGDQGGIGDEGWRLGTDGHEVSGEISGALIDFSRWGGEDFWHQGVGADALGMIDPSG